MNSFRPISNLTFLSKEPLRSDSASTLSCTSYIASPPICWSFVPFHRDSCRHSDDWTDDNSWHSRHHDETSMLHRSNSGMVQIAMTSTESSKNRTDLVRVKGQSKEDDRSWLELVHRSWCYKAAVSVVCDLAVNTVHVSSFQHCRPQLIFPSSAFKISSTILGAEVTSGLVSAN